MTPAAVLRGTVGALCAVALFAVFPVSAHAQKARFVDAFVSFHSRLIGTYGDEGPEITASLDRMVASLAEWEREAGAAEAALRSQPASAPADLGVLYLDRGRLDDALVAFDAAIQAEPGRAAFHRLRGLILEVIGRQDEAVAALTKAWELDGTDPMTAYLLADRRIAINSAESIDPQIAALLAAYEGGLPAPGRAPRPFVQLALLEDRAADTPIFSPALYADGLALMAGGRYREAMARFRDAVARDPVAVDPAARSEQMARGIASLRAGRLGAAIESLEAAVKAMPDSSEAHRILGAAYRANRDDARSVEHLNAAVRLAPNDERARVGLGLALMDAGRNEEAERALRDTITALPASAEARWALADLFEKLGRGNEAIGELEAAVSSTVLAGKHQLYWRLAERAHRQQDYERVAVALARRARLIPNEAAAHKDLGLAYTRLGRPKEALIELLMSTLLGLADAETLAAIGQIHLDAGRFADAETVLQRAVAQQPDLPQARYALGSALIRLGRTEEGKQHLAEFQRLRSEALESQRRSFEGGLGAGEPNRPPPEPAR